MGFLWRALVALCLLVGAAHADTGGRIGGGSWGGGGSRSSSSSGSWGHSSSSSSSSWGFSSSSSSSHAWDFGSHSYSSSSSGSGVDLGGAGWLIIVIGIVVIGGVSMFLQSWSSNANANLYGYSPSYDPGPNPSFFREADVGVLRVALDGRARKFVQSELKRIAGTADMSTSQGRATTLREVALSLRRLKDAWIYGGAINEDMGTNANAKQLFDRHVDDARSRFREETVANVQGKQVPVAQASEYTPHAHEGAGVILVTIVLAARRELYSVRAIGTGQDLRAALEAAGTISPEDLIAVEIIWQPSEDADRLSSMELEAKYPSPDLIKIQGALAGKMFCTYCGGPFPAELVTCPHCGAPAREPAST